jgi:16S rRNA processing protein RimM
VSDGGGSRQPRRDGGADPAGAGGVDLVPVGRVGRPHGTDGSFFVEDASEADERFARGARLHVDGVVLEVVAAKRGAGGRRVIRLDRAVPRGASLCVPRSELPPPDEDAYYVFELVGLRVEEEGGRALGEVADVENLPANDVLVLDTGVLLPLVDACVLEVDVASRRIVVAPGFADGE